MFVIPINDDRYQRFSVDLDGYDTLFHVKCPPDCRPDRAPSIDIFVSGYDAIEGLPLIPATELLSPYISAGCLPSDMGAIIPVTADGSSTLTCEDLYEGRAAILFLSGFERYYMQFFMSAGDVF